MISRRVCVKRRADRAKSKTVSPFMQRPHNPSIAGAGSPHCLQNGGSTGIRLDQHPGHAAPYRRSRTGARQTTHVTGNKRLRMLSSKERLGENARADSSIANSRGAAQGWNKVAKRPPAAYFEYGKL